MSHGRNGESRMSDRKKKIVQAKKANGKRTFTKKPGMRKSR